VNFFYYLVYKLFKLLVRVLPKKLVKIFLDLLTKLIYTIDKKHRAIVQANLDFVYENEISVNQKISISKMSYRNLVYNLYEFIDNQVLSQADIISKVQIKNEQSILNALKEDRKVILITPHYGNWELGSTLIPLKYGPTTMVGRAMNNHHLNNEIDETRTRNNTEMLTTDEAARGLVKALKNKRIVGMVIDQHNRLGIDVSFLGHTVKQTDASSKLAIKFNAVIIPVFFRMESFGKYIAEFYDPIEPNEFEGENQVASLTQKQADIMSDYILKYPEQWFWQHKRFKYYNKDIYE